MKRYMNTALLYAIFAMAGEYFIGNLPNLTVSLTKRLLQLYILIIFCWVWFFSCFCCCWRKAFPSPELKPGGFLWSITSA